MWHERLRLVAYLNAMVVMAWTVVIVLPIEPFSYVLVIIERGGPGTWFLLAYLIFILIGAIGFGALSTIAYIIEFSEKRRLPASLAAIGFALAYSGTMASCLLLAYAGLLGGYELYVANISVVSVARTLNAFVAPSAIAVILAVAGYAALIASLMKAS